MELENERLAINQIDEQLIRLFVKRMEIAGKIAQYKQEHHLPVRDASREEEILRNLCAQVPENLQDAAVQLYQLLFELSRSHQQKIMQKEVSR